ncbi:DUF5686 and carboxypeptidase-like regulatory domain-containing protein [Taibaiella soli]|uniref:Carboxypeptidase-like regulatory domain-containing protein n=1 Tax=Taibaiella soli TaxID=1649169 RepID=A0A2W2AUI9_9BACT|nr:DUF5686 and carboxypeptidase-like regulatory domain-containing protein [Taibaiella soli]PZF71348.1 hypothetical protein DN068_18825 [Taibaiella soli]
MNLPRKPVFGFVVFALILFSQTLFAQSVYKGVVNDANTHQPLPFATVHILHSAQGQITDLNGSFKLIVPENEQILEVSYLGYEPLKYEIKRGDSFLRIELKPATGTLKEVVIKPPYDKIKRILNLAIANRDRHNPDKYDAYQCRIYYKMTADLILPDSIPAAQKTKSYQDTKDVMDDMHLLMTETYSIRSWKKPAQLQEDIIGSRLSGFKKNYFTNIITDVLPFHAANDYLQLNGKDYHNPVSKGYASRYEFNLDNEILSGTDTIWQFSFHPKKGVEELEGQVYISSDEYAIAYLIATAYDKTLRRTVRVEQQYQKVRGRWFPHMLNYIIDWQQKKDSLTYDIYMKGTSGIDSVNYAIPETFHFDKMHTVRLEKGANELHDTAWTQLRPVSLDKKEQNTYHNLDSLVASVHGEKVLPYLDKLIDLKVPVSIFDIDLKRIYTYNPYEHSRWGLGLQTNEKLLKWMSVGGWAGYGVKDVHWKYGGFAEFYLDKYKEFSFKFGYNNDLRDPGRVQLNPELDRNYLHSLLMSRVDQINSYYGLVKKRFGYLTAELIGRYEQITPKYDYAFTPENQPSPMNEFTSQEAIVNLRYAYAEHTSPFFSRYISTGTKYPVLYGRLVLGQIQSGDWNTSYTQAFAGISWQKHINLIGQERFLLIGGKSWSNQPLPLSKLFAGNGYLADKSSLYAFGGMMTMHPYDYYTDQFVNFYWAHNFDWKLYKLDMPDFAFSSAPSIGIAYNFLYGTMEHREAQQNISFAVPDNAYHETGILLNNLLRYNQKVYYLTLNVGYFYHWIGDQLNDKNGRFVFGLGIEF